MTQDPRTDDQRDVIERAALLFKHAQTGLRLPILEGLSSPDVEKRRKTASYLMENLVPALDLDEDARSRQSSLETLSSLVMDLRPPQSAREVTDLDNALFHLTRRLILNK
jgi:hypothetical protein